MSKYCTYTVHLFCLILKHKKCISLLTCCLTAYSSVLPVPVPVNLYIYTYFYLLHDFCWLTGAGLWLEEGTTEDSGAIIGSMYQTHCDNGKYVSLILPSLPLPFMCVLHLAFVDMHNQHSKQTQGTWGSHHAHANAYFKGSVSPALDCVWKMTKLFPIIRCSVQKWTCQMCKLHFNLLMKCGMSTDKPWQSCDVMFHASLQGVAEHHNRSLKGKGVM